MFESNNMLDTANIKNEETKHSSAIILIFIIISRTFRGIIINLKIHITLYTFKTSFAATNVKTGLVRTDVWKKEFAYINIIASGFVFIEAQIEPIQ